ncbi:MAG: DUF2894 domain-containing protein [Acidobacteriota bacterium]
MTDTAAAAEAAIRSTLASWRQEGKHRRDPLRFHYLEALAQRLTHQPEGVRRVLLGKLTQAVADYAERLGAPLEPQPTDATQATAAKGEQAGRRPLADLNHYIQSRQHEGADAVGAWPSSQPTLKSVRRFGQVWAKIAADQQVDQAMKRGPENAGPLNSHMLVLRAMALMRQLSPDYLRHFLPQVDTLLWLEQINQQNALTQAKPEARRPRAKK